MRNNDNVNGFTDLNEHSFLRPPHVVVKADDISFREIITEADLYAASGRTRDVIYEDGDGNKKHLRLVPYVHPSGAATLTIGTQATGADGTVTYTPSAEGRMIDETGVLVLAGSLPADAAGVLFTDYYYLFNDDLSSHDLFRVTEIAEGDFLWLIREGVWEVDCTGAITDGKHVVISETVAGECEQATDVSYANVAAIADTLPENILGKAAPNLGLAVGRALETTLGAGLALIQLELPARYQRTN